MCFNVDVLATEDVGMVLDVSVEVHVDTAAVGVVELAIAGEGTFHKYSDNLWDTKLFCIISSICHIP